MVCFRAALEYRREFERPRRFDKLPVGVFLQRLLRILEVRTEVGAKIEPAVGRGVVRGVRKKLRLQDAVLAMTQLRPRIREQDENFIELRCGGKRLEEKAGFRAQKEEIFPSGAGALAQRSPDPIARDVDPDAGFPGMGLGVGSEKMPMAAADFPDDGSRTGKDSAELGGQSGARFHQEGLIGRGACRIIHVDCVPRSLGGVSPARFDADHQHADIRGIHAANPAGLTEGQRLQLRQLNGTFFP